MAAPFAAPARELFDRHRTNALGLEGDRRRQVEGFQQATKRC
jgi:hypothetical protein